MGKSMISKTTLAKMENSRKVILRTAIWILVGGVVLGAVLILFGGTSNSEVIGKFMGTMFIVALMMMISVNNFRRIASEVPSVQLSALVGLVANIVWAVLWILICWNPDWAWRTCREYPSDYYMHSSCERYVVFTWIFKVAVVASYLSWMGFICSNVLSIYEGEKRKMIRPLKVTSAACMVYVTMYAIMMTLMDFVVEDEFAVRLGMLAGFVGLAWLLITIMALILAKSEKNKRAAMAQREKEMKAERFDQMMGVASVGGAAIPVGNTVPMKTEAELRAEIEEQVRREMIEKEVRERLAQEMMNGVKDNVVREGMVGMGGDVEDAAAIETDVVHGATEDNGQNS